jgi:hypothetical protein
MRGRPGRRIVRVRDFPSAPEKDAVSGDVFAKRRLGHFIREYAVAQKEQRASPKSAPEANPAELAHMGKKQVEAMIDVQKEFIDTFEDVNRQWLARLKAETDLATEFAGKLAAAKSIPDTAAICQEWINRRMELFAEDGRRFVADIQKFTTASTRFLPKGWQGGSS